jgi:hypothetical protein
MLRILCEFDTKLRILYGETILYHELVVYNHVL